MNIIERYASAFIVQSITGANGENPGFVYEVLKETEAKSGEPILQTVIDMVKGSAEDGEGLRSAVAGLVVGAMSEEKYVAFCSEEGEHMICSVWQDGKPIFAVKKRFPGITLTKV